MNLIDGIKKILDHNGILFLGSGFSTGGKNFNGQNMKTGAELSRAICRNLGIKESDNLSISSQRYIEDPKCKKSLAEFIEFLSKELVCTEISQDQKIIANLPWKRIYTTNYDNSFELASEECGYIRSSITITNKRYKPGRQLEQAIVHINGSILNLNEESSSIFSQYIVREGKMKNQMLEMLKKIYYKCSLFDDAYGKYYQQRRNMISRSNISLLLNTEVEEKLGKSDEELILNYYDNIKNLPTASENPYFWLQFGITALNLDNYQQASIYFDNAYTNALKMKNFDTFQIDTHKARLLLCSEMNKNSTNSNDAMETFFKAHELLLHNSNKGEKMRYVLRQVGRYYEYYSYYLSIFSEDEKKDFISKAYEMRSRFEGYFCSLGNQKVSIEICRAYLNYRKIFEKTGYLLKLKETDRYYNEKVCNNYLMAK